MLSGRSVLIFGCLAAALCAAVVPGAFTLLWFVLVPLLVLLPQALPICVQLATARPEPQLLSLHSLYSSRAPPAA